jgi:hypothetical protein
MTAMRGAKPGPLVILGQVRALRSRTQAGDPAQNHDRNKSNEPPALFTLDPRTAARAPPFEDDGGQPGAAEDAARK